LRPSRVHLWKQMTNKLVPIPATHLTSTVSANKPRHKFIFSCVYRHDNISTFSYQKW
jgi:hypothetical protein